MARITLMTNLLNSERRPFFIFRAGSDFDQGRQSESATPFASLTTCELQLNDRQRRARAIGAISDIRGQIV